MEIREQEVTGRALGSAPGEGRGREGRSRSGLRGKLHSNACQQGWVLGFHRWAEGAQSSLLHPASHPTWTALGGGRDLGRGSNLPPK